MAIGNTKILVEEILRNESTRKTAVALGNKSLITPSYATKIRNSKELDIVCENYLDLANIPCLVFDIHSVNKVQQKRELGQRQKTLFGESTEKDYSFLKENAVFLIDPYTELFYYQSPDRKDYKAIKGLPDPIRNILDNSDVKTHFADWSRLFEGKHVQSIANWYARFQSENNADVIIPPSPLIDGIHNKLVDYAVEVNRKTISAADDLDKPSALYFLLNFPIFQNSEMFSQLNTDLFDILIEDDEELSNVKLIIIKIKNYRFADEDGSVARENLKIFLTALGIIARNTKRGVLLLDADSLGLIALFNGIDCYAEPLNGKIQEQWGKASTKTYLGKYYHPEKLVSLPFEELNNRIYKKGNKILPCNCPACLSLNGKNLEADRDLWNMKRKLHKLYCRNQEINEVVKAIEKNEIRGITHKLGKSSISQYKDILTNGF